MHDTDDANFPRIADERPSIIFSVPSVNDNRLPGLGCQRDLRSKGGSLRFSRRIVVVIVEAALADRNGAAF